MKTGRGECNMELVIKNITKDYHKRCALNNFTITLKEGIYGLLGPNGAGKSTLMKIITRNIKPTEGEILCDGESIYRMSDKYREMIGYMPQQQELYPFYTGRSFLTYMGMLKGVNRKQLAEDIEFYAGKVNLKDRLDQKIGTYSGGMKQRLLIAQAFLGDSKILVFDEPTAGLDPKERVHVRQLIHDNAKDKIIIVATHVVQDIESIASEIILLKDGYLVNAASPEQLVRETGDDSVTDLEEVYMEIFGDR
jgi:ABC-type multidrug transport system ATPase subunit